ncbi:SecDF P1 head subdomain-containing protein [Bradyrhizobium sp. USDA 3315]
MSFKGRSLLFALASLLWISGCMADELALVLSSAEATHEKRTGKPVVDLAFPKASREPLHKWSQDNVGKMIELLVDGQVVYRGMLREPMYGPHLRIDGGDRTDEATNDLVRQISKTPNGEIKLRSSPASN